MKEDNVVSDRNMRKTDVGMVVSDKMDKTAVVAIENSVKHPLYNKRRWRQSTHYGDSSSFKR